MEEVEGKRLWKVSLTAFSVDLSSTSIWAVSSRKFRDERRRTSGA